MKQCLMLNTPTHLMQYGVLLLLPGNVLMSSKGSAATQHIIRQRTNTPAVKLWVLCVGREGGSDTA